MIFEFLFLGNYSLVLLTKSFLKTIIIPSILYTPYITVIYNTVIIIVFKKDFVKSTKE